MPSPFVPARSRDRRALTRELPARLVVFLGLLAGAAVLATAARATGAAPARFAQVSVEHGLSQSTVQAILQDHVGFLWFGTEEGLNRYDGYTVTVFRHDAADPRSLPSDRISALHEDAGQRLWVGTDAGLSVFDRRSDAFVHEDSVKGRVTGFAEDPDGTLWVGVEGHGLFERVAATGAFLPHRKDAAEPQSFGSYVPSALLRDRAGRLWIGTKDHGLELLKQEGPPRAGGGRAARRRFVHYRHDPADPESLAHDEVWGLAEDPAGGLWVGTYGGGLSLLDPERGTFRRYRYRPNEPKGLGSDLVTAVLADSTGAVWIGTDGAGVQRWDPVHEAFVAQRHDPRRPGSLSQDTVRALYEDRQRQLWVGTHLGGVNLLRRPHHAFEYYTYAEDASGLAHPTITRFLEDAGGSIWVSTADAWLHRFDRDTGTFERQRLPESVPGVLAMHQDRGGRLWLGTYRGGLVRFDPDARTFTAHRRRPGDPTSLGNDEVWTIAEDEEGTLWLGTNDGLDRFDPESGKVVAHHDTPRLGSPSNAGVRALHLDRWGSLWVGSMGGLHILPRRGQRLVRVRPEDATLAQDGVVSLHEDDEGRLWVGTFGGGLKLLEPTKGDLASYKLFPSNVIYGIEEDSRGRLWLSTNEGLSRFDPVTGNVESFDLTNGLQSLRFSLGASLRTREGRLLFGSVDGFYDFDPDAIKPDTYAPPVVFTSLRVFNEPVALPASLTTLDEVELSFADKVFSIEFAALDYTLPRKNQYAYRMAGFNDEWLQLGARREVTFTNLDPGDYGFQVRATNGDGVWSGAGAEMRVVVRPPFWGTWWFRALGGTVAVLALVAAHRARVRRLTADLGERMRTEVALRQAQEKYRSIFDNAREGIFQCSAEGRLLTANPALARMLGYDSPDELLAAGEGAGPEGSERPFDLRRILEGEGASVHGVTVEVERRDGSTIWISASARAVRDASGAVVHYEGTAQDVTERKLAREKIEYQAYHDALTGLPNRRLFQDRLAQARIRAQRYRHLLAVAFLDVDDFKVVNDTLGHAAGDRLLQGVADRLRACVRQEDTVARLGGDEFTLLFGDVRQAEHAGQMAEKVLGALAEPFLLDGRELHVTASMGIAVYPADGEDAETLLRNADAAMYRAKAQGRNTYQICTPGVNARARGRMALEAGLRQALDREELVLHYQPLVSLGTGQAVGIEALVRWQHPEDGLLLPEVFLPLAEETRLIVPIGEWVLSTACRQLRACHAEGLGSLRMSVNLSMRQLQQPDLVRRLEAVLGETGVAPGSLELDIAEGVAMQDLEWTRGVLRSLRETGCRIALDDFGTGPSSLGRLRHSPLSTIKVDRSLVGEIAAGPRDAAIVRTVIALAHDLDLGVVAEGVETTAQLDFLREAGCEDGQGRLFSPPLPAAALRQALASPASRT